jgi:hypothetical protein
MAWLLQGKSNPLCPPRAKHLSQRHRWILDPLYSSRPCQQCLKLANTPDTLPRMGLARKYHTRMIIRHPNEIRHRVFRHAKAPTNVPSILKPVAALQLMNEWRAG